MAVKAPVFPGYTPITHRIFIRDEKPGASNLESAKRDAIPTDPTTILVYGWGDGRPRNVAKYSEGYHALFPSARIVVIISPIWAASTQTLPVRTQEMMPIIDTIFPTKDNSSERVIMHVMSNTGGIYAGATLNAYHERHGPNAALPHYLCVSDSTPGGLNLLSEVWRWSRAMAMGAPKWLPLPFIFVQALCCLFLIFMTYGAIALGLEPSGDQSIRVFNDNGFATPKALRLYCYSKEDDLIYWEDLEKQAAFARSNGYRTVLEEFKGSPHVGHMRMHPEQYWSAILRSWKEAVDMNKLGAKGKA
ncbi:hypothetical protein GGR50DRAFT_174459 [Xylaria sp. CBS 124048]|nr:hypothetical protein GGR50DRAFT_174459 [Xylaria sp. CBS 124048]